MPNVEHTCYYVRSDAVYHKLNINQTNIIGAHGTGGIETGRARRVDLTADILTPLKHYTSADLHKMAQLI